ncbi:MAG: hypothetical protein GY794_16690 [bacterium]|nr:hypothetical protein [bacterium]
MRAVLLCVDVTVNRNLRSPAVWMTGIISFAAGLIVNYGLGPDGVLADAPALTGVSKWVQANISTMKTFTGVAVVLRTPGVFESCDHIKQNDLARCLLIQVVNSEGTICTQ